MIIKSPPAYDTSHWETIPDFALVEPRPLLVITKATEALTFVDPTFTTYMADLKQDGISRGCFHFHRKAVNSAEQAKHFCNAVRAHVDKDTVLALDVEEGGETAAQLQSWLAEVERQFPDNLIVIYSRKNILDPIAMTTAQKDFFRRFPIWTAGYPSNPDAYASVPDFYVPDQTKYGPVWLWQYSDKGTVKGIEEPVDLNWVSPVLAAVLGWDEASGDRISRPFDGVTRVSGRRYGSDFWITIMDPSKVRFEVLCFDNLARPSEIARSHHAQLAWNGDGWNTRILPPWKPLDLAISNGKVVTPRQAFRPSFDLQGGRIYHEGAYGANVMSGFRYIGRNGQFALDMGDTEYVTELHPRSAKGLDRNGFVMAFSCDGRSTANRGMTLLEVWNVMREYRCVTAFDHDSGGSTVDVLNGTVQNKPSDGVERAVAMTVLAYAGSGGSMAYGLAKEVLGKTGTVRTSPEAVSGNDTGKRVQPFSTIEFVEVVAGKSVPADKWFKLPDGNFLNYILAGRAYFQITREPIPDVPEPPAEGVADMPYTITLGGGSSPYVETVVTGVVKAK